MATESAANVIVVPTPDEAKEIIEAYATAVGKVAHAWNYLLERLGDLFVTVTETVPAVGAAIWYAPDSDRTQILMLQAAIAATPHDKWLPRLPQSREDLAWLADSALKLANDRNNAVHAPCSLMIDADGSSMMASYFSGHRRAKNLRGKQLLVARLSGWKGRRSG